MATLKLSLSERLAREARAAGLLEPKAIEKLIRAEIRRRQVNQLFKAADRLAALDTAPLTSVQVEKEIQAARAKRRIRASRR